MSQLRMQKINSLIQRKLSEIINRDFVEKIGFTSINFVQTTKDLNYTKVYVSFTSPDPQKCFLQLQKYRNLIQRDFGHDIELRKTPKIEFEMDSKFGNIMKVEKILDKISKNHED